MDPKTCECPLCQVKREWPECPICEQEREANPMRRVALLTRYGVSIGHAMGQLEAQVSARTGGNARLDTEAFGQFMLAGLCKAHGEALLDTAAEIQREKREDVHVASGTH